MALSGYFLLSMLLEGRLASRTSASVEASSAAAGHQVLIQAPNATGGGFGIGARVRELWGGWTGYNISDAAAGSLERHHQLPEWDDSAVSVESVRKDVDLGRKGRLGGAGGLLRQGFLWLGLGIQHSNNVLPVVSLPETVPENLPGNDADRLAMEGYRALEEAKAKEARGMTFVMPHGLESLGTGVAGLWQPPSGGAFWGAVQGKRVLLVTRDWPQGCFIGRSVLNVAGARLPFLS
jgi:hypothetical protein